MSQPLDIEALEARVANSPGDSGFATLAEAYRRLGRLDDARRVAVAGLAMRPDDTQGRLALGLTLLDLGEAAAARYELERAMGALGAIAGDGLADFDPCREEGDADRTQAGRPFGPSDAAEGVGDAELDEAFERAEPVRDEMVDATRIAQQAMRDGQLDVPEGFAVDSTPTFTTETMARLLDEQGDRETADAIRARLERRAAGTPLDAAEVPAGLMSPAPGVALTNGVGLSNRTVATLESWLDNLQRSRA